MSASASYNKKEKLKSRKLIEQIFAEGKSVSVPPLRLVYLKPPDMLDVPVKAGVSVSSRNFKKATDRNRIKRLLREAYRLNKAELTANAEATGQQLAIFIIYTDRSLPTFEQLNSKMQLILNKLIKISGEAPAKNS